MLNRMIRVAAFQNPEFYKAQAMRLPTWDKPRVISCSEEFAQHLALPRGCLQEVTRTAERTWHPRADSRRTLRRQAH